MPDVRFFRQRRLGQQRIHTVTDVTAVSARIFFEGAGILRQPDVTSQVVTQNFEIDLPVAGQFRKRHFHRQQLQSSSILFQPCLTSFGTDVVQQMIKSMIAEQRGFQRSHEERFLQMRLEKCLQFFIRSLCDDRCDEAVCDNDYNQDMLAHVGSIITRSPRAKPMRGMALAGQFVNPRCMQGGTGDCAKVGFMRASELSGFCSVGADRVAGAVCRNAAQCESLGHRPRKRQYRTWKP